MGNISKIVFKWDGDQLFPSILRKGGTTMGTEVLDAGEMILTLGSCGLQEAEKEETKYQGHSLVTFVEKIWQWYTCVYQWILTTLGINSKLFSLTIKTLH